MKLVDTQDLKSCDLKRSCGFDSRPWYKIRPKVSTKALTSGNHLSLRQKRGLGRSSGLVLRLIGQLMWLGVLWSASQFSSYAQSPPKLSIQVSPSELHTRQRLSVTVSIEGEELKKHGPFPEIKGFRKQATSSSTKINVSPAGLQVIGSLTQYYIPLKVGTYQIPAMKIRVNNHTATHPGLQVQVREAPPQKQIPPSRRRGVFDYFAEFFDEPQAEEFIEIKDDAFLALTTSKKEVFIGEGLGITLAFYVSETNQAPMEFYKIEDQLNKLVSQLKPQGCWEESIPFNMQRERVEIQGKPYTRYVLYRSVAYPLQEKSLKFPSLGLKMLKYKLSKSPSVWGRRKEPDYKTFYSQPKEVRVKALPPHPLKDQVAVGKYRLIEKSTPQKLKTGKSYNYSFHISGEGNISAIKAPRLKEQPTLEVYPPQIQQQIHRSEGHVFGEKKFIYHIIPQEAGQYALSDLFKWIYFDPQRVRYDTLLPQLHLEVTGKSNLDQRVDYQIKDPFYAKLYQKAVESWAWQLEKHKHWLSAFVLFGLLTGIVVLLTYKRNKPQK